MRLENEGALFLCEINIRKAKAECAQCGFLVPADILKVTKYKKGPHYAIILSAL